MAKAPITTIAQVAPASPDAELIRLLAAAEAACRTWQYADPGKPTLAELIAERPWTPMVRQAAAMPATTPEGVHAKAQAVRWWILGDDLQWPDHLHGPIELLAASLVKDLLGGSAGMVVRAV